MPKNLIKKGIFAVSAFLVLVVACLFWFGSISTAWFRRQNIIYVSISYILDYTR